MPFGSGKRTFDGRIFNGSFRRIKIRCRIGGAGCGFKSRAGFQERAFRNRKARSNDGNALRRRNVGKLVQNRLGGIEYLEGFVFVIQGDFASTSRNREGSTGQKHVFDTENEGLSRGVGNGMPGKRERFAGCVGDRKIFEIQIVFGIGKKFRKKRKRHRLGKRKEGDKKRENGDTGNRHGNGGESPRILCDGAGEKNGKNPEKNRPYRPFLANRSRNRSFRVFRFV